MAKNAFPKAGGIVNGNVDATGYVKSGEGKDVVSSQDIWAKRYIYESGLRVYSPNNKPSAEEVGAYPKSGGVVNGNVDATGYISGKGVYEAPGIRVYSQLNKPTAGDVGAYTKGESDERYGSKNTALKSTNGWWRCGDTGMIYQWGVTRVLNPEEVIIVQLPIRFSNVCLCVMLTVNRLGSGSGVASGYVADLNTSSFKLTNDYAVSGISVGYYWFAVGY
ncbi:gp53-like domain-containing protein [Photorhabdus heterorhabditis]|uniref:Putative tail fiber protein gp53-like C-terminal domain-containing protein n=1 Tax=Photorhabdus heterorhabditis TaxID=880156 RepID=A0A5B0VJJ0_9GAMM|nr:hypothetical protein [Photorhabdus heterorhabditis]KAA1174644.1 hypothetical protein F0L16_20795 [Photorhabdus heterorhabditis]